MSMFGCALFSITVWLTRLAWVRSCSWRRARPWRWRSLYTYLHMCVARQHGCAAVPSASRAHQGGVCCTYFSITVCLTHLCRMDAQLFLAPGASTRKAAAAAGKALAGGALRHSGWAWGDVAAYEAEVNALPRFLVDTGLASGALMLC